jgi:hypothetical protein
MSYSINHNPYVRKRIISFDSRFRDASYPNAADFMYHLSFPIRNVISVRLSSIEYPNTYFVFSRMRGNTTMRIAFPGYENAVDPGKTYLEITIPDGNFTTITGDASSLTEVIRTAIAEKVASKVSSASGFLPRDPLITLSINGSTGHVSIDSMSSPPIPFTLDFSGGPFDHRNYDWGLGYNLGFPYKVYSSPATSFTGNAIIDTVGAAYIFFQLDNIEPIQHYSPDKNIIFAFAKLVITGDKNTVVYDDGGLYVTKEYRFPQPVDFFQIHPRMVDPYGELVDFNGKNYSFTLELEEVTNTMAYKQYRDNALTKPSEWNATYTA